MIDADNLSGEVEQTEADAGTEEASPEMIREAKAIGWVAPENWKGTPPKSGFLSPQEYVRRSKKIMPIVRAESRKWQDEATKLRGELETTRAEHSKTISRIERMSTLALEQQRAQIEEKYASRKEAAVELGDKDAYRQAVKDEKEASRALDERLKENEPETKTNGKTAPDLPKAVQDTIEGWRADNKWFTDDPTDEMTAYATAVHVRLQKEKKGLTLKENLEEVSARVRKRFPEEFGTSSDDDTTDDDDKPARGSRVEGGSRSLGAGGVKTAWSQIPAEAKAQADKFIKEDGLFLNKGETVEKDLQRARERYAAKYLGDDK